MAATLAACSSASVRGGLAPDACATFRLDAGAPARVPFEFSERRRIFVPVTVNGVATVALLDTGASSTVLDSAFAARIGVVAARTIEARGFGGRTTAGVGRDVALGVGAARFEGLAPAILDLSDAARRSGHEIPVIVGEDVFERAVVDVDVPGRTLAFLAPETFEPPPDATRVPLGRAGYLRTAPVSVEGREEIAASVDLGCGYPLVLQHAYWSRAGLLERRRKSTGLALGVGGVFEQTAATLTAIRFGGVEFPGVPAGFLPVEASTPGARSTPAVLGLPVLARFHLWIDFPHDALHLRPDAARLRSSFARDRLGLTLEAEPGVLRVIHVAAGSPAAAAGFRVGELLAAIDGRAAASWTPPERRELGDRPVGTFVTIRLADGTSRRVVLADYY